MKGILVKDGPDVVEKHVFAGDISIVPDKLAQMQKENPSLTYEIHSDDEPSWNTDFELQTIVRKPTKEQTDWDKARNLGPEAAMDFLAKKLGFE